MANNQKTNPKNKNIGISVLTVLWLLMSLTVAGQAPKGGKPISADLFGLFFEDINYSADGGLYAEVVQNRSFEYNPTERREWHPYSFWEYVTPGYSFGRVSVETALPIHPNNPHYVVLDVEHVGHEAQYTGLSGVGLKNSGFDGIVVRQGENYHFSMMAQRLSDTSVTMMVSLQTPQGKVLAETTVLVTSTQWTKVTATLNAAEPCDSASLVILATTPGKVALDVVSLFPEKTFKNRPNGLRADLAQMLADMHPKFIRFPGGCLVHGDGLGNMYRWKNTIGPIEQRREQRNIWGYHQTSGLGFFEYFQFCEDIDAKPLPVLPAAVSCQNSGGTWRIGGTGQKALPTAQMDEYIQEILDLIEWANGDTNTVWGAKRAQAGHPEPFNLQYVGIGNEDKITPEFELRFNQIFEAVKAKYPNITVVGTSGPFHSGDDFDRGWKLANDQKIPVVDEHYYTTPEWFISHQNRYDTYNRKATKVYLGEYASWGNKLRNALAEAAFMTGLERNADVVQMASYAPLLAKKGFTQWTTDMIFFDNTTICPTPNFYVQQLFMQNQGDFYYKNVVTKNDKDSTQAASCVGDSATGDIILKMVNAGPQVQPMLVNLSAFKSLMPTAALTFLAGQPNDENTFENPRTIVPEKREFPVSQKFKYDAPPMSLSVIRIKTQK